MIEYECGRVAQWQSASFTSKRSLVRTQARPLMNKNKIIFYLVWIFLVSLGPITVLSNTNLALLSTNRSLLVNFIQRLLGLIAFSMLFIQLMLGAFMQRWTEKLGGWVLKFHTTEGPLIYMLILIHPALFGVIRYFGKFGIDPFYIYTQICVLCGKNPLEYYYSLGRLSFWLITIAVTAALLRFSTPFMRAHWRKFHVLNYLAFLLIGIHGFSLGTDFTSMPFFGFAIVAYLIVLYVVIFKKLPELFSNFRRWLA